MVNNKKIEILYNSVIQAIKGDQLVRAIVVENLQTKAVQELAVSGVFIEVGRQAHTEWLSNILELNEKKEIVVDYNGQTSTSSLFAAGDVTSVNQKQIAIATGEGVKAALACYTYLLKKKGQSTPGVDWGRK